MDSKQATQQGRAASQSPHKQGKSTQFLEVPNDSSKIKAITIAADLKAAVLGKGEISQPIHINNGGGEGSGGGGDERQ